MLNKRTSFKTLWCWWILGWLLLSVAWGNEAKMTVESSVPWGASERMEYAVFEKGGGDRVGGAVFSIESIQRDQISLWNIRLEVLLNQPAVSVVEVDQDSFLPLYSYYRSDVLGEIEATYKGAGVSVERRLNSNAKHLKQDEFTYDLYQACYLMRLFPVELEYQRKLFVTNSKQPNEQSAATLRIVGFDDVTTLTGERVECYRVDSKIDEIRSSFWISTDEKRWIYRIVDGSGVTMELIAPKTSESGVFESENYRYQFQLPKQWMAFVQEKRKGPEREQVAIMTPGLNVDLTLTRHRKFGDAATVADGSLKWLQQNREAFQLLKGSMVRFDTKSQTGVGQLFEGRFREGDTWMYLLNGVVESGDSLFIYTGIAEKDAFDPLKPEMIQLLKSVHTIGD